MKILITDIDEVLLDWSDSFDKFLREEYQYDGCHLRDNPKRLWDVVGVHESDIGGVMAGHNDSPAFAYLDYKKDSAILKDNYKKFDKIIAVTSCGSEASIQEKRIKNLKEKFGDIFDDIEFLDFLNPKHEALQRIKDTFSNDKIYMIDDSVKDVAHARKIGIDAYVYKATFHDPKDLPVVESFSEFLEKL